MIPADDLEALIAWRRDVRHFETRAVPEPVVEHLLELAQLAPSVGNAQPWRFVRLKSPSLREPLAVHVDRAVADAGKAYGESDRGTLYASLKLHGLREAPEIMAVFCDEQPAEGHRLGIATMPEALRYSTVLAIHTLWLAARNEGIGLGWVSIVDPAFVSALLDVPAGWHFVALLCLGYPLAPSIRPELEQRGWQDRRDWRANISER